MFIDLFRIISISWCYLLKNKVCSIDSAQVIDHYVNAR